MPGPLAGVRVIDLTAVLLGPFATQHLADMGADVIKVEPPEGDLLRLSGGSMGRDKSMGPIYMAANRNKRSLCLDLKKPAACAVLKDLVKSADLFVHNSRPQAIERLGLGYDELKKINPGLIYAYSLGYKRSGPYGHKPAFDDLVQGVSGAASLQSRVDGLPPRFMPLAERAGLMRALDDWALEQAVQHAVAWARKFSLFQYPFVTACCGMEFMSVNCSHYDTDRFGAALPRFTPRQSDLLWVVGTVNHKLAPVLLRYAPAIRIVPLSDDTELVAATRRRSATSACCAPGCRSRCCASSRSTFSASARPSRPSTATPWCAAACLASKAATRLWAIAS